jgi:hypothetical protein
MAPLPNCRSIWESARSRALERSETGTATTGGPILSTVRRVQHPNGATASAHDLRRATHLCRRRMHPPVHHRWRAQVPRTTRVARHQISRLLEHPYYTVWLPHCQWHVRPRRWPAFTSLSGCGGGVARAPLGHGSCLRLLPGGAGGRPDDAYLDAGDGAPALRSGAIEDDLNCPVIDDDFQGFTDAGHVVRTPFRSYLSELYPTRIARSDAAMPIPDVPSAD